MPFLLIYTAADILAVFFLFRMGGVLPIVTAIILMLGMMALSGVLLACVAEIVDKRKEKKNEGMGSEASGDDVSAGGQSDLRRD